MEVTVDYSLIGIRDFNDRQGSLDILKFSFSS